MLKICLAFGGNKDTVIVIGNINFRSTEEGIVKIPKYNKDSELVPITLESVPKSENGKMKVDMMAGEIQVYQISGYEIK